MKKLIFILLGLELILILLLPLCFAWEVTNEHADGFEKMFSMIFDLHSKEMGYKRTESICGFGTSMKERGYAIYKGKKYLPDDRGFIIINTNK